MASHHDRAVQLLAEAQLHHNDGDGDRCRLALAASQVHATLSVHRSLSEIENSIRRLDLA